MINAEIYLHPHINNLLEKSNHIGYNINMPICLRRNKFAPGVVMAKWNRSLTSTYPTGGLMLIYFGVGVCILIFVFAYYTRQISHLNADIEAQIEIFVNLAAELPSIEDRALQERLLKVMRQELYAEGRSRRFSFIITDADGNVEISQGIDTKLDEKVNETDTVSLTQDEQELLTSTLERMKSKNQRRKIPFLKEDRQIMGYFYYGEVQRQVNWHNFLMQITDTEKTPTEMADVEGCHHHR